MRHIFLAISLGLATLMSAVAQEENPAIAKIYTIGLAEFKNGLELLNDGTYQVLRDQNNNFNTVKCTGFLVGEKQILTAGHCLRSANYELISYIRVGPSFPLKIVFSNKLTSITEDEVYSVVEIVQARNSRLFGDYALLELDRKVETRPLKLTLNVDNKSNHTLSTQGHDAGSVKQIKKSHLKIKAAVDPGPEHLFIIESEFFDGMSGAPVWDESENKVIGLISGKSISAPKTTYVQKIPNLQKKDIDLEFLEAIYFGNLQLAKLYLSLNIVEPENIFISYSDGSQLNAVNLAIIGYMKFKQTDSIKFLIEQSITIDENSKALIQMLYDEGDSTLKELVNL